MSQLSLIPGGGSAVMASRQAQTPDDLDYFPTPPWAARAGAALINAVDPGLWTCWEPAAGGGHMAHGLRDGFERVFESDLHPHQPGLREFDFLGGGPSPGRVAEGFDWIVTNPPFRDGEAFVRQALKSARRGVAMLLRLQFKEGIGRYGLFHDPATRLALAAPFAERVPMVRGRWDPEASSATAYCWFVWLQPVALAGSPMRAAIEACWAERGYLERTIPPGQRAALTRESDLLRFGGLEDMALLAEAG